MARIEDIKEIVRVKGGKGYEIVFKDERKIWMTKARTIVALLVLLKYGEGSESDIAAGQNKIPQLKKILAGKYPDGLIQDFYRDANKPFSELWNEEGFSFIGQGRRTKGHRNQIYALRPEDHERLFLPAPKANRAIPSRRAIGNIKQRVPDGCNLCGAHVIAKDADLPVLSFSRDRLKRRIDHRMPIEHHPEKGNDPDNFQILCFYCNKSKWQICHSCTDPVCEKCVLAFPESTSIIHPTQEDISDRIVGS